MLIAICGAYFGQGEEYSIVNAGLGFNDDDGEREGEGGSENEGEGEEEEDGEVLEDGETKGEDDDDEWDDEDGERWIMEEEEEGTGSGTGVVGGIVGVGESDMSIPGESIVICGVKRGMSDVVSSGSMDEDVL